MKRVACAALLVLFAQAAFGADVMKGGQIYRVHCASCHGAGGMSTRQCSELRSRRAPDAAGPDAARFHPQGRGDAGFFGVLSDRDTLDVIAYLRTMR